MRPATASPPVAYRDRVKALLGYAMEAQLSGAAVPVDLPPAASPWDLWWVCFRAQASARNLGLEHAIGTGRCSACARDVETLVAADPPGHPHQLPGGDCTCLHDWAVLMRSPAPEIQWPPLRSMIAVVKPGGDRAEVYHMLTEGHAIVDRAERHLTADDVRRLYPDAYGAAYVARQDQYLTSGPVEVMTLVAAPWAAPRAKSIKAAIRHRLGSQDVLRNHLHMPDNPGDALADLHHLAGPGVLNDLYGRYDRDGAPERLAGYRAVLGSR